MWVPVGEPEGGGEQIMIPDIGMMVGVYIFTRMIGVLAGPDATGA